MARYIGRRLLQLIPVFFGATFLIYAMIYLMPGDHVAALGGDKGLTPAVKLQIEKQYHLDQPLIVQYFYYLKGIFHLDFGRTLRGDRPVIEVMAEAFPTTIRLALMAIVFESVFGILFGVFAGLKRGGFFDSTVLIASLLIIAVPVFVLGVVLQVLIGVKLGWLPPTVQEVDGVPTFKSMLMPAIVLGAVSFAYVLRLTRTEVGENATADYVRTATAKGLSRPKVVLRHILRNSLIPVITFIGADLGALMGGAIVTEGIFNIPGVGNTMYKAIIHGEGATVVSFTTVLVLVYMVTSLLVDLFYAALDPRIRYE